MKQEVKLKRYFTTPFRFFGRIWFTGLLYILAGFGYLFYFLLFTVRFIQMKFLKSLLVLIILTATALGGFLYWGFYAPEDSRGDEIEFRIERGTSLVKISAELEEIGAVPNKKLFYYYMRAKGLSNSIKAGLFKIPENAGIIAVSELLQNPLPEGIMVKIPEGMTIWQSASKIMEQFPIDSTEFVDLCSDTAFISSLGLEGDTSLEGYLYPETYSIPKESSTKDVIAIMVKQFKKIYETLPTTGKGASFDRHSLVTLASIVEKEAQVAHERARISAVFHNRLDQGIPLGADPTVRYAIRKFSGPLRVSELRNKSPYNTRIHKGLIPGPICSPGKAALAATIQPIESNELFFVAKWDGSGEHYFSVTNAEHNRRKMQVRKENAELSNW